MNINCIGKPAGCKLIRVRAEIEGDRLVAISIRGDFFAVPEEAFERLESRLAPCKLDSFEDRFNELVREEALELIGISATAIMQLINDALRSQPDETSV